MTEPDELETRWPRVVARLLLCGTLIVVFYVLSIGPVVWLGQRSGNISPWQQQLYRPLLIVSEEAGASRLLDRYVIWWASLPGGPLDLRSQSLPPPVRQNLLDDDLH